MLRRLGSGFEAAFRALTPDPFVLAGLLTLVTFLAAWALQGAGPLEILRAWQGPRGFWGLLPFTMQMLLILVTGHALAAAPPVRTLLTRVAALPRSGAQAGALVAAVAVVAALLNWGLGLIVGALTARDVARSCASRGIPHHYPLLVAAGYAGLMVWHGGLSGSAPLTVSTGTNLAALLGPETAAGLAPIPFTATVLSLPNLLLAVALLLTLPLVVYGLTPAAADAKGIDAFVPAREPEPPPPAEGLAASASVRLAVAVPLAAGVGLFFWESGVAKLDPNALNLIFLTLGLFLHGSLRAYSDAVAEGVKGTSGIVLQFPFYAGIIGVLRDTGLVRDLAAALAAGSSAALYPVITFVSAGLVNLFVPSGGGQWAVQGPIAVGAARTLGLPLPQVVMAVAYGDQATNMLQPFWALPVLALTGVKARDILGFTALLMLFGGALMVAALLLWPALAPA